MDVSARGGRFELAGRLVLGVGAVVEAAIGDGPPAVCERTRKSSPNRTLWGETIGVTDAVALQHPCPLSLRR